MFPPYGHARCCAASTTARGTTTRQHLKRCSKVAARTPQARPRRRRKKPRAPPSGCAPRSAGRAARYDSARWLTAPPMTAELPERTRSLFDALFDVAPAEAIE
jgi:hypothetical protein